MKLVKQGDTVDMNDTRDESPVITDKSDEMSFEQQWSLLCTQFGLDPAAVGTSTGPSLYTIPEEPTNSIDHSMRWSQLLLFSKQILNGAFSIIKKAVDLVNPSGLSSDASTAGTPQSVVHRMLIGLENLIDMSVNDQNQGQSVNSEPPPVPPLPVPPLPDYTNYGNFISEEPGSHSCVNFKAEIPCINGNFYVQDYENVDENYGKLDGNMNFSTNPFNCPTASTFAPQFYERNFELPFTNHNQLSNNSISSLEPENKMTHESQPEDPKSSITPRESFEFSLGQSAKSFFERLDAKSKLKSRETNPFKIDDESDKFHANNWSPVASSLSSKTSTKNPFVSEGSEVLRKENLSPTRVVYEAPPLMYDLSSENKTQRELSRVPASPVKKNEPETFQAAKQKNVASWVEQGGNLKSNYDERDPVPEVLPTAVSDDRLYPCDFPTAKPSVSVNTKASKVPPPLPPRPRASNATTNSFTENIGLQWYSVAGNAKLSKEYPVSRDIAAGTGRINGERGVTRQTEVVRTVEPSTSGCGFTEIYLTKHTVYAIHLDNEGWLAIEEFLMAFTSYNIPGVVLKILEIQNVHIPFRYIDRAEYPELFDTLERTPLAVPRNHNNKIGDKLHLVPIKSITKMLRKLKIVDTKTVEQALKKKIFPKSCSALYDAFTIIAICGNKCQGSQS